MPAQTRETWLDVARGVSICLVVFYHTTLWFDAYGASSPWFNALNQLFRPIRMPLFFFVSGVLARKICLSDTIDGAYRRICSSLYLYVIWSVILWLEFVLIDCNQRQIPFGQSVYDLIAIWYRPESGFWTLWALSIHIGLAWALRRFDGRLVTVLALLASGAFMARSDSALNFAQLGVVWYFPFFCAGIHFGGAISKILTDLDGRTVLLTAGAFALSGFLVTRVEHPLVFGMLRLSTCVFGLTLTSMICHKICRRGRFIGVFDYLGRNTAPIFLVNEGVEALFTKIAMTGAADLGLSRLSYAPVVAFLTILVALGLQALSRRAGATCLFSCPATIERAVSADRIRTVVARLLVQPGRVATARS